MDEHSLHRDVQDYELWLRRHCDVVESDLLEKHVRMAADPFLFLRATYFRWARTVPSICPDLMTGPRVASVGDVHVENYGTWMDADGRHVWGLNDFDEAAVMPYTMDLLRLVCSASLVADMDIPTRKLASSVLQGYTDGLTKPAPVLLSQGPAWYPDVIDRLAGRAGGFWAKYVEASEAVPPEPVQRILMNACPQGSELEKFCAIRRGGGSLGRPRFQALVRWQGGYLLREARAIVPSAWDWANGREKKSRIGDLSVGANRSPDPSIHVEPGWLVRRVSPDSHKLDLREFGGRKVLRKVLCAMGAELGSVHAAHRLSASIPADMARREKHWLATASEQLLAHVKADHKVWRRHVKAGATSINSSGSHQIHVLPSNAEESQIA